MAASGGLGGRHSATAQPVGPAEALRRVIIDRGRVAAALPGYEIGAELGAGGFGLVVAARHRRLKREVAIKMIPAEAVVAGGEFSTEAELLASLDHPHIVRVHDYLETDGLGLIVMELLAGGTLTRRSRGLSQPQACAVGLAIAAGLAHAHDRGILHRDIKPSNVLFDGAGLAKLGDFGIARMFTGSGATGTPHGAGTPTYMAPEQIGGGRLSPATDQYALGVLLYQLLTGAPPFDPSLPPPQLWQQHLASPPPAPQGVPRPVADVVLRTLAKSPADRYPDADTFAAALAVGAVTVYGPGWLADTGVPLRLTDPIRHVAVPPLSAGAPAAGGRRSDVTDDVTVSMPSQERLEAVAALSEAGTMSAARGTSAVRHPTLSEPAGSGSARRRPRRRVVALAAITAVVIAAVAIATMGVLLAVEFSRGESSARTPLARITEHTSYVKAVAFNPDGDLFATAGADKAIVLWNIADPAHPVELARIAHHAGTVWSVAFSSNGKILAAASDDKTATLWNVSDPSRPRLMSTLTDHRGVVSAVAFSPDGHLLATASHDRTAVIWDVVNPSRPVRLAELTGHRDAIWGISFSPAGDTLATASADHTVKLWNMEDPANPVDTAMLTGHASYINSMAFSADGKTLATGSTDTKVILWNISDRRRPTQLATIQPSAGAVYALAFSADGKTLIAGNSDNDVATVWNVTDLRHPKASATLAGHTGAVEALAFSPDGRLLATGSGDNTVILWKIG